MAKIDSDKLGSKIEGHSYYHGDRILSAIYCMAEGKEVENVKPTNVYDKDVDMGKSTFGQRVRLQEEYDEWIGKRNKELYQNHPGFQLDKGSMQNAIIFLEEKGYRRVFYD